MLCNKLRRLYDWKYALIARVFILDHDTLPKTIPVKTKQGLCGLAVICAVCEEVFASLWSVRCPNYSAAIMKYYHAITQRCATHSSRAEKVLRIVCCSATLWTGRLGSTVGGPHLRWPGLMNYGAPAASSILQRKREIRSLLAPAYALTANVFLINAEPSSFIWRLS